MRKGLIYMLVGAACVVLAAFFYMQNSAQTPLPVATTQNSASSTVQIGGETLRVTVAATEAARERGLSGRTGLADDEGMLFVFPRDGKYAFWMKDMTREFNIIKQHLRVSSNVQGICERSSTPFCGARNASNYQSLIVRPSP